MKLPDSTMVRVDFESDGRNGFTIHGPYDVEICPTCRGDGRVVYWVGEHRMDWGRYVQGGYAWASDEDSMSYAILTAPFSPDKTFAQARLCRTCGGQRVVEVTEVTDVPR